MPLERRVVGLRGRNDSLVEHPPIDAQPLPLGRLHLVRDRDVRVQIRVTGPAVPVGESSGHQPLDVDLTDPVGASSAVQRVRLDERQRVLDRRLVRQLDPRGQRRVGQGPQRADRLHRAERQVETGNRGRLRPRVLGDRGRQLAGIGRVAAVLGAEELRADLRADARALIDGHGVVAGQAVALVVGGQGPGHFDPEVAHVALIDLEGQTDPRGLVDLFSRRASSLERCLTLVGQRVDAQPEQGVHLIGRDDVTGRQALHPGHPGPDPLPGGLAALGVVGRETCAATQLGRVVGGDLAGQVVVPAPGRQLVQGHHTRTKHAQGGFTDGR